MDENVPEDLALLSAAPAMPVMQVPGSPAAAGAYESVPQELALLSGVPSMPVMQILGTTAAPQPRATSQRATTSCSALHESTISSAAPNPEPARALNLLLKRLDLQVQFTESIVDESTGTWSCTASTVDVSVEGRGRGKKAAKREASSALLAALEEKHAI